MRVEVEKIDVRVDQYLSEVLALSRSKIQNLIKEEKVLVNEKKIKANYLLKEGDLIFVDDCLDYQITVDAENIPLDIVFEDSYLCIINKKSGMVVHPAPGHYHATLVNAFLYHLKQQSTTNLRPGIVHRLDKDTSGVMVVAKDERCHELLSDMIKNKQVERKYLAIVDGVIPNDSGEIRVPIGRDPINRQKMAATDINSKEAITHFKVLKRYSKNTLVECLLDTGRTHQIRVHFAYIGYPVSNDPLYNTKNATSFGQMLHSKSIKFMHPVTQKEIYFEVDAPEEFQNFLSQLG